MRYTVALRIQERRVELDVVVDTTRGLPTIGAELIFDPDGYNLQLLVLAIREVFSGEHQVFVGAVPVTGAALRAKTLLVTDEIFDLPTRCPNVLDVREIQRKETTP